MNPKVKSGLRILAFLVNDSRRGTFREEILSYLDKLEGKFNSVWVADHIILRFTDIPKTNFAERLAKEVAPRFQ